MHNSAYVAKSSMRRKLMLKDKKLTVIGRAFRFQPCKNLIFVLPGIQFKQFPKLVHVMSSACKFRDEDMYMLQIITFGLVCTQKSQEFCTDNIGPELWNVCRSRGEIGVQIHGFAVRLVPC